MDKKTTDIICHITIIGWIASFLAGDKEHSKFFLNQALVIHLASLAVNLVSYVLGSLPFAGIAFRLLSALITVCLVFSFVWACMGQEKKIPVLGELKIIK